MPFKRVGAKLQGQKHGTVNYVQDPQLVGETALVPVTINGVRSSALCDTGSCVSTCSESFYHNNLSRVELQPLSDLHVECAEGSNLPYKGFISVSLGTPDLIQSGVQPCLLLVVPDTNFNKRTPILLGTNLLIPLKSRCQENFGIHFLQKRRLSAPWDIAFRCLSSRERALKKVNNQLAVLRSCHVSNLKLQPNQSIQIECSLDKVIDHPVTSALIVPSTS